jgi:hypothetical protein
MSNLAIDSKLRGCDLVGQRVRDIIHGNQPPRTTTKTIVAEQG